MADVTLNMLNKIRNGFKDNKISAMVNIFAYILPNITWPMDDYICIQVVQEIV